MLPSEMKSQKASCTPKGVIPKEGISALNTMNWPLGLQKAAGKDWTRQLGSTVLPYCPMC